MLYMFMSLNVFSGGPRRKYPFLNTSQDVKKEYANT